MTQGVVDVATVPSATPPPVEQAFCRPFGVHGMILQPARRVPTDRALGILEPDPGVLRTNSKERRSVDRMTQGVVDV
eukprot:CAMPEP_0172063446 /NCGR_PEP_ID=MMETSP1043-20130122/9576_1 /TAXON_ID=464988 /ORGANISM="Hemiselmis andersenii, Strain CCMP441" /LENGTH=76 /DNA_ID=CAMNT_0012723427 /DNA_START=86 /DNA_END=313 /DNA_ORIENTATION=-